MKATIATEAEGPAFGAWAFAQASEPDAVRPDMEMVRQFLGALYAHVPSGIVAFRKIAEPKDGRPGQNEHFALDNAFLENAERFVADCSREHWAAYFLPGTVTPGGTHKSDVLSLPALVVDWDGGDIEGQLRAAEALIGPATVIVESGGVASDGARKLHAHWRLAEPATGEDVALACQVREALAVRFGGDRSFKQPAQVVRIGGSLHQKSGPVLSRVRVVRESAEYALADVCRALGVAGNGASNVVPFSMDFNGSAPGASVERVLTQPILAEGKSGDVTRFQGAGSAIGHYVRLMRDPVTRWTEEQARQAARDWNAAINSPPWTDERVMHDFDRLLRTDEQDRGPMPAQRPTAGEWARFEDWTGEQFKGAPTPRKYLVDGVLPLGVPGVVAAAGGLGKSYLMLDLAYRVATGAPVQDMDFSTEQLILGGAVREFGTAVLFCAEDDRTTIHERLAALDSQGKRFTKRLRPIPLPDAGGPRALFVCDREGYKTSPEFDATRAWLKSLPDLRLVCFDPLQTLVAADITSKPEAGQFVMATLGTLAVELGATVLVTHHMKKTDQAISTLEDARAAIRGTTALVDGVRFAYALWDAPGEGGAVAAGGVAKSNSKSDTSIHQYKRLPCGVLRQILPTFDPDARNERMAALAFAIGEAAKSGRPFTMTGANGLFDQQHRLPEPFRSMPRAGLDMLAKAALKQGVIVKGTARGNKQRNVLDVPEGDFAYGHGVVMNGAGEQLA